MGPDYGPGRAIRKGEFAGLLGIVRAFLVKDRPEFGQMAGVLFWGGFNWAMEMTNTEKFCISCHEMETTPYAELQETIHYSNRTGVRATCPELMVALRSPRSW